MTTTPIRVGVLGAGFMGSTHARAYAKLPGVEIAAIHARSGKRARPLAEELGSVFTDSLDRVLGDDSIAAVDICLPTPEHRPSLEAALAAGKHVLLEKPLALTEPDARAMVDAAAASDRIVMIAHVLRFWPEYVELKRVIDSGELGRPLAAYATRRQPFPAWSKQFNQSDLTGGAIIDMLVHDYDVLNWILGTPRTVTARALRNERSAGLDQAQVLIGYDGAQAVSDGGMMMPESYPFTSGLDVLCENGAIEYHFRAGGRSFEIGEPTNTLTVYRTEGDPEPLTVEQSDPYENEVAYFIECVRSGTPANRATPEDALAALRVALAARASAEQETTIDLV
jgi:predicted dehydrogenase